MHQHHIRRINGYIRTGADGHTDIGSGQGRRVVNTIAHHNDLALPHQVAHHLFLALGQHAGNHPIDSRLPTDSRSGARIVAGEHHDTNTHLLQCCDSFRAVRLNHISHGDHTQQCAIIGKEQGRFALLRQRCRLLFHIFRHRHPTTHIAETAAQQQFAVQRCLQSIARQRLKIRDRFRRDLPFRAVCGHRFCQRVLTLLFQRTGQRCQAAFLHPEGRYQVCHLRRALGNGTGFVQHHDLCLAGLLQRHSGLKENAVFGTQPVAHHNGYRRGQSQCARTADHQHGDPAGQRIAKALTGKQPHHGGHQGDGHHHRHKHAGHPIGDLGNGRLGGGSVADHLNDLGQSGVLPHPSGTAP